jgi:hypothetical protein
MRRSDGQVDGELGRQLAVRKPPNAIGAEQTTHGPALVSAC